MSAERMNRARQWVDKAIAAGIDPKLLHYPPGDRQEGRWFSLNEAENDALDPGPRPEDIVAEIREVLYERGRAWDYADGKFYRRLPYAQPSRAQSRENRRRFS